MTTIACDPLCEYLEQNGGRDILVFETAGLASDAAHALREKHHGLPVKISASYNKVFVELEDQ